MHDQYPKKQNHEKSDGEKEREEVASLTEKADRIFEQHSPVEVTLPDGTREEVVRAEESPSFLKRRTSPDGVVSYEETNVWSQAHDRGSVKRTWLADGESMTVVSSTELRGEQPEVRADLMALAATQRDLDYKYPTREEDRLKKGRSFGRAAVRSMFRRKDRSETVQQSELIPATTGKTLSLLPGYEDGPKQRVRILSRYGVKGKDGQKSLRTELIWAQSAVEGDESVVVGNLTEALFTMGEEVEKGMTNPTNRAGRYIVEYPREKWEDPIQGAVYMLGKDLMRYDFVESVDGIVITGEQVMRSPLEVIDTPPGTRVTASVSMDEAGEVKYSDRQLERKYRKNIVQIVNTKEPTPEEEFTQQIRGALAKYRTRPIQS